ncbi:MAG: D-2-hydroxyacid dehydrogenase [Pseudomonadota bacterium]
MTSTANVLILLNQPEKIRMQYYDGIRAMFPELTVDIVDHHNKVGPYIATAQILITTAMIMEDHVLREAVNLRWIHTVQTGTNGIDDLPSLRPEVLLTSTRGIHGAAMSEAAIMAMLALNRDLPRMIRNQDRGAWERWFGRLLDGKTVGIFGVGLIGAALAPRCKALGMTVIGVDPIQRSVAGVDRMVSWDKVRQVIGELDFVVLFLPSTTSTRGIINFDLLAAMKPSAYLINLGRGDVLDDEALIKAMDEGRIAGAALDVFREEPLPRDHPFWSRKNIIITPHVGGAFDEYAKRTLPIIQENMRKFLAGDTENMINLVRH